VLSTFCYFFAFSVYLSGGWNGSLERSYALIFHKIMGRVYLSTAPTIVES